MTAKPETLPPDSGSLQIRQFFKREEEKIQEKRRISPLPGSGEEPPKPPLAFLLFPFLFLTIYRYEFC